MRSHEEMWGLGDRFVFSLCITDHSFPSHEKGQSLFKPGQFYSIDSSLEQDRSLCLC